MNTEISESITYAQIQQLAVLDLYKSGIVVPFRFTRLELLEFLTPGSEVRERFLLSMAGMTESEEKFVTLFKQAYDKAADVSTMSYEVLDSWITDLEDILLTAKAQVQGATLAKKERKAKLSKEERDKTPEGYSLGDVSDSIASVRKRADRISKRDKTEASLRDLGLSDDDVKKMMSRISVNEDTQPSKNAVTFHKTDDQKEADSERKTGMNLDRLVDSILKKENQPEDKPFDPSSLFS